MRQMMRCTICFQCSAFGTHLDAFAKLDRIPNPRFAPKTNGSRSWFKYDIDSTNELLAFDSTVGCMHVCDDKKENISFLNDFWFSTNLNGPLYNKKILLNAWQDMDFSHPGDLEGNWYFRKPRLPRYHLMLQRLSLSPTMAETRQGQITTMIAKMSVRRMTMRAITWQRCTKHTKTLS